MTNTRRWPDDFKEENNATLKAWRDRLASGEPDPVLAHVTSDRISATRVQLGGLIDEVWKRAKETDRMPARQVSDELLDRWLEWIAQGGGIPK